MYANWPNKQLKMFLKHFEMIWESAYLIIKLLLFQSQTKVHGVKRPSSARSLAFSWVHAGVSYYLNKLVSLLIVCATIVVLQRHCAICYLWGPEKGEEGWRVNLPPDSKWKMSSFSRHGDIHTRDVPFHILFDVLHKKRSVCEESRFAGRS